MISLEELKKNIDSTSQLEDITQALQQSAAAYIIKTRNGILSSRNFLKETWKTYEIVQKVRIKEEKAENKSIVVAIYPNQGMFGSLFWQETNMARQFIAEKRCDLAVVGKKGKGVFEIGSGKISQFEYPDKFDYNNFESLAETVFLYDNIDIVYPEYENAFSQTVVTASLTDKEAKDLTKEDILLAKRYTFDPSFVEVKEYFGKAILGVMLFSYVSESVLAYKAAEMISMKRARDNAHDKFLQNKFEYFRGYRELIDSRLREVFSTKNLLEDE